MLDVAPLIALCLAAAPPEGPEAPTVKLPAEPHAPVALVPKVSVLEAAGLPPTAANAKTATPEKTATKEASKKGTPLDGPLPPSLTAEALRDELRRAARSGASSASRLDEERAQLKAERAELQQLAEEINRARQGLREETSRLVTATQKPGKVAPESASAKPAPTKGAPPQDSNAKKKDGMKEIAKTLQGMKPDLAATVLERLGPELSTQLFRRLKPDEAAPIAEKLHPEFAARLFHALAAVSRQEESSK